MGLAQLAIDILLVGYVFFSWTTIGYIFLRTGWPKIRVLSKEVRLGWALVITLALNITIIISSILLAFLLPFTSFRGYLLLNLIVFSFTGIAVLTVRRKLFAGRAVAISVPKSAGTKIATAGTAKKVEPKKWDVIISKKGREKLDELKKSLDAKKAVEKKITPENKIESLMGIIPKKVVQAEMRKPEPKAVKVEAKKVPEKVDVKPMPPKPKAADIPKEEKPEKQGADIFGRLRGIFGRDMKVKAEKPGAAKPKESIHTKLEDPVFSKPTPKKIAPAPKAATAPKPMPVPKPAPAPKAAVAPKAAPVQEVEGPFGKKKSPEKKAVLPVKKRRLALPAPKPKPAKPGKWAAASAEKKITRPAPPPPKSAKPIAPMAKPATVKPEKIAPATEKVVAAEPKNIEGIKKSTESKTEKPEGALAKLRKRLEKKEVALETKEKEKKAEKETSGIEIIDLPAPKIEERKPAPLPARKESAGKMGGLFGRLSNVLKSKEERPKSITSEGETPSIMDALEMRRREKEGTGQKDVQPPKPEPKGIKKSAERKVEADVVSEHSREKEPTEKIIKDKKKDILRGLKNIMKKKPAPESPKIGFGGKSLNPLWKNLREEVNLKAQGKLKRATAKEKGIGWKDMEDVEELSKMDEQIEEMGEEISKSDFDKSDPLYRLMKLSGELPDKKKKKGENNA